MITQNQQERYQRQMLLDGFGEAGQSRLLQSKVLVIGAGGLGCPALQYLAAAGTGTLGIVDDDVVSISNLHRQVLYTAEDAGFLKTERAASRLRLLNPEILIITHTLRLNSKNALQIIAGYDMVIDGTDNFASRYLINDACVLLDKPLVYAAVSKFEGQAAIFNVADQDGVKINYRHLFPEPPKDGEVLNCAEAGVLGALPGIMGAMQAAEAIKLITGTGKPLAGQLLTYDALTSRMYSINLSASKSTVYSMPADADAFMNTDYEELCAAPAVAEIDADTFNKWLEEKKMTIIDVREYGEKPQGLFGHLQIPLSQFNENTWIIPGGQIVVFCQTGKRSLQAAILLQNRYGNTKQIYSLRGGISALMQ